MEIPSTSLSVETGFYAIVDRTQRRKIHPREQSQVILRDKITQQAVRIGDFLRADAKFDGLEELKSAIAQDAEDARAGDVFEVSFARDRRETERMAFSPFLPH